MPHEYSRNIQDAAFVTATFALPTTLLAAGSKTSAGIDLGPDTWKPEQIEVSLDVPALSATIAPAAATGGVTYSVEASDTVGFSSVLVVVGSLNIAGSASGVAATSARFRLPSNCPRYIRGRVTLATTCTDASAVSASVSLRF